MDKESFKESARVVEEEYFREVAKASGGLVKVLGLGSGVSVEEEGLIEAITTTLRGHRRLEQDR
jgi:hypothetical protein